MIPTIGRIVLYTLDENDAKSINADRRDITRRGNRVRGGDVFPMMITKVWGGEPTSAVNGQVHLDGNDIYWVTSVQAGDGPRHFSWPQRPVGEKPVEPIQCPQPPAAATGGS